jgi:hypothetical protein
MKLNTICLPPLIVGVALAIYGGTVARSEAAPPPAESIQSATSVPRADYNGDGYDDLAIGVPGEDLEGTGDPMVDAGAVNVIYGSPQGLAATAARPGELWTKDRLGLAGEGSAASEAFGYTTAAGDFNGDGYSDLAVTAIAEEVDGIEKSGSVTIIYGSATGLTAAAAQFITKKSLGIPGLTYSPINEFGFGLITGDLDGDGFAELVVGTSSEDVNGATDAGAVFILSGSAAGLNGGAAPRIITQDTPGIADTAESEDYFGVGLAIANFGKSPYLDLAIGVSGESFGTSIYGGAVHVLYGGPSGVTAVGSQFWQQNSAGIADTVESDDWFGYSLAGADLGRTGYADLAVGVVKEDLVIGGAPVVDAGAVHILYGSADGLTATGSQFWHQNSSGIQDQVEDGDYFGSTLVAANFGKSRQADLAIDAVGEDIEARAGVITRAGGVNVLYGSADGLQSTGNQWLGAPNPGAHDWFGYAMTAGNFNSNFQADLAVGMPRRALPGPDGTTLVDAGAVRVLYGHGSNSGLTNSGAQMWSQASPFVEGVAEAEDYFGDSFPGGE